MNIKDILEEEISRLDEVISRAKTDLKRAPEGSLVTCMQRGHIRFYHRRRGSMKTYLPLKRDIGLIRALAQKRYAMKVMKVACMQKTLIDKFISQYNPQEILQLEGRLADAGLISPYTKQHDDSPFSVNPVPVVDPDLVSQMMDLCSRILNKSSS